MGCPRALQGGWAQRGFLRTGLVVVGEDVRVSAAAAAASATAAIGVEVSVAGMTVSTVSEVPLSSVEVWLISAGAVPPQRGETSSRVVAGCRLSDATVSEGGRCRPARRIRRSEGRFAEAERKSRTSEMEFEGRTFSGIAFRLRLSVDVSQRNAIFNGP